MDAVVSLPDLQGIETIGVVGILGKELLSVMAALDDMVWIMRQDQPGVTRHMGHLYDTG